MKYQMSGVIAALLEIYEKAHENVHDNVPLRISS